MKDYKLPNKLHLLLIDALADEAKAHRSPRYEVNMDDWHEPFIRDDKALCYVCFAGAVMAFGLGADINSQVRTAEEFDESHKLIALDHIREGYMILALANFYHMNSDYVAERFHFIQVTEYDVDRLEWRKDMFKIAKTLKELDL